MLYIAGLSAYVDTTGNHALKHSSGSSSHPMIMMMMMKAKSWMESPRVT
jgi:hypothetical protein